MNRFIVSRNSLCGAQLAMGSTSTDAGGLMYLSNGLLSNNETCGINLQTKNFDVNNLNKNVLFINNNYNNLDSDTHFIPDILERLARTEKRGVTD